MSWEDLYIDNGEGDALPIPMQMTFPVCPYCQDSTTYNIRAEWKGVREIPLEAFVYTPDLRGYSHTTYIVQCEKCKQRVGTRNSDMEITIDANTVRMEYSNKEAA